MSHVHLLFSTSRRDPISGLIRLATWSQFSHVAIIDGCEVIEASGHRDAMGRPAGVRAIPLTEAVAWDCATVGVIPHPNPNGVLDFCRSQVGRPYDWGYVFGIAFRKDWEHRDKWACPELIAAGAAAAGQPWFRHDRVKRVTQEHLWMLAETAWEIA